ncbi:unnamed protein product [Cylicocyclus nassatus]|uniref:Uncharacterized protein n=1 Tax=Cylicocyclus nassatus TaxID=53992 RepID=A0AA36MBU2_CYLNA|nr:unnamed protein product [Cylicocyclus nassatus]
MDKDNEFKQEIGNKEKELPTEEEKLVDSGKELKDIAETTHDAVNNDEAKNILDNMSEKLTGVKKGVGFVFTDHTCLNVKFIADRSG